MQVLRRRLSAFVCLLTAVAMLLSAVPYAWANCSCITRIKAGSTDIASACCHEIAPQPARSCCDVNGDSSPSCCCCEKKTERRALPQPTGNDRALSCHCSCLPVDSVPPAPPASQLNSDRLDFLSVFEVDCTFVYVSRRAERAHDPPGSALVRESFLTRMNC